MYTKDEIYEAFDPTASDIHEYIREQVPWKLWIKIDTQFPNFVGSITDDISGGLGDTLRN